MRPLSLEMTAFGSYAETTKLPFEELKHGLYLVTGDTGAGKTTIFDAIMFALFGVASGADRKGDMLHCDYVSKSTDTVVTLRFAQNGKTYTVERRIHFSKKRGTTDQFGDGTISALLCQPDSAPIEGSTKVTERCEQLLGLNAEQFSRIIMLAQGEFKKFLKANSDEKNDILGKLFDNSVYVYYQELLLGARDELKKRRSAETEELRELMEISFQRPQDLHGMEQEAFLPGHPALSDNLQHLIREETKCVENWSAERDSAFQKLSEVSTQQGEAAAMNALLEELAREQTRLDALEALDEEMRQRQTALDRTDAALHEALPAVRRAEQAEDDLQLNIVEIADLESDLSEIDLAVAAAEAAVAADETLEQEKRELETQIHTIEEQLPRYAELAQKRQAKQQAERKLNTSAEQRAVEEGDLSRAEGELSAFRDRLEALDGVDAELAACQTAEQRAAERVESLSGKTGLRGEIAAIQKQEAELETEKAELFRLTSAASGASAHADALYQQFLAAQAAVLAGDLQQALTEHGEAECPVCGTRLHREHLPRLPQFPDATPDKNAVDAAREASAQAERRRSAQDAAVQAKDATIRARKQAVLERAAVLLPECGSWDALIEQGYLDAVIETARQNAKLCAERLSAAENQQTERDTIRQQLPQIEQSLQTIRDQIAALRNEEQTQQGLIQAAEAAIQVLKTQLPGEDETLAREEKTRLEKRTDQIAQGIQKHRQALSEARSKRDTIQGSLSEKRNAVEKLTIARNEALEDRERILAATGFESPEAVRLTLESIREQDAETWIRAERKALSEHEINKKNARELIQTRRAQTEGKQIVDLTALEQKKQALSEHHRLANETFAQQDNLLHNHRSVFKRVTEIQKTLAESDHAWSRLERLAALAGGASSESGKLSFDRYVMGAMFREILEMANRRMELMSGGRYELVHKIGADRRNAKAGLEIEVLDNNTGVLRGSGSLSGGESFFTSLALALGLSDVVQNHAGGKQMDALFIDEGFGTLSDDVLDKALDVLGQLTEGNRLVGIISHVDKLDESIPQKIRVRHGENGSTLTVELA